MDDQPTCGKGLAEHSAVPAKLAELLDALSSTLETHIPAIDVSDENGRREHEAYASLQRKFRDIAQRLRETAQQMASYRDLPMARHHMHVMTSPGVRNSFRTYVRVEEELLRHLQQSAPRNREMLAAMESAPGR